MSMSNTLRTVERGELAHKGLKERLDALEEIRAELQKVEIKVSKNSGTTWEKIGGPQSVPG